MPEDKFIFLGKRIRSARKECQLTQQELADQSGLAVKTIQDIEKGRKNPTYETLCLLVDRLGISGNTIFPSKAPVDEEALQYFLGKFYACNKQNQKLLINSLNFLVEYKTILILIILRKPADQRALVCRTLFPYFTTHLI